MVVTEAKGKPGKQTQITEKRRERLLLSLTTAFKRVCCINNTAPRYRSGIEKAYRWLAMFYITGCGSCPQARQ